MATQEEKRQRTKSNLSEHSSKIQKQDQKPSKTNEEVHDFDDHTPPSRRGTYPDFPQNRESVPLKSKTDLPGPKTFPDDPDQKEPSREYAAPSSLAKGKRVPSNTRSYKEPPVSKRQASNTSRTRAESLPPLHLPSATSRIIGTATIRPAEAQASQPLDQREDEVSVRGDRTMSITSENKKTPRHNSLPPITQPQSQEKASFDTSSIPQANSVEESGEVSNLGSKGIPSSVFGSRTSLNQPLPNIPISKEPRHPRNIYINKKIDLLESLNKKLKDGPWEEAGIWGEPKPKEPIINLEGPYTFDDVIYEEDESETKPLSERTIKEEKEKVFDLPIAYNPETGEVHREIAKAAALLSSAQVDPTESKLAADPLLPSTCDCCKDMNDHNEHLRNLDMQNKTPRVVQAKKVEEALGERQEALSYYRSASPVLIPVSKYVEKDIAEQELLKLGVAKELVEKLKMVAKPKNNLSANEVPWPFYAHDMSETTDLHQYLDNGLPNSTDALMQADLGAANSKYKESMGRLEKVMRKFQKY